MPDFDPYHRWLGIPAREQPPNHYRLLGLVNFESDVEVINDAADRQLSHVRRYQKGEHRDLATRLLNEISQAHVVLINSTKKQAYDQALAESLMPIAKPVVAPIAPPPPVGYPSPIANLTPTKTDSTAKLKLIVILSSGFLGIVILVLIIAALNRSGSDNESDMADIKNRMSKGSSEKSADKIPKSVSDHKHRLQSAKTTPFAKKFSFYDLGDQEIKQGETLKLRLFEKLPAGGVVKLVDDSPGDALLSDHGILEWKIAADQEPKQYPFRCQIEFPDSAEQSQTFSFVVSVLAKKSRLTDMNPITDSLKIPRGIRYEIPLKIARGENLLKDFDVEIEPFQSNNLSSCQFDKSSSAIILLTREEGPAELFTLKLKIQSGDSQSLTKEIPLVFEKIYEPTFVVVFRSDSRRVLSIVEATKDELDKKILQSIRARKRIDRFISFRHGSKTKALFLESPSDLPWKYIFERQSSYQNKFNLTNKERDLYASQSGSWTEINKELYKFQLMDKITEPNQSNWGLRSLSNWSNLDAVIKEQSSRNRYISGVSTFSTLDGKFQISTVWSAAKKYNTPVAWHLTLDELKARVIENRRRSIVPNNVASIHEDGINRFIFCSEKNVNVKSKVMFGIRLSDLAKTIEDNKRFQLGIWDMALEKNGRHHSISPK